MTSLSESFICVYCNKEYSNKYVLTNHQKTAKKCLKLQDELKNNQFQCQYCSKKFSTKFNLSQHEKTSKSCYMTRSDDTRVELTLFDCSYCQKSFSKKKYLDKHFIGCSVLNEKKQIEDKLQKLEYEYKDDKQKLTLQVKEFQDEIKSLNKQLDNGRLENNTLATKLKEVEKQLIKQENLNKHLQDRLLEKATTKTNNTTNTTNNNIDLKLFISEEVVNQKIQSKFNKTHLVHGYNGIANFIKSEIVTNEEGKLLYTCSDPSRQIFNYIDEKGNEVKDIKGTKMISLVKPKLIEKTCQIQAKEQNEYNYLCNRYNGDDEVADEDVQKRIDQHKFYSDIAADMLVNKIGDTKFPSKMSSELVKVLT
jgi:hypothetical protein